MSSSSSSSPSEVFEVFLSFRGEDTRKGFTGHLYEALDNRGVDTFMDDERLEFGESIGDNLQKAIEGSSICIPVFSPNYAASRWCLMELAKMIDCKKTIIPVFYHVAPSDVRKQKGPLEAAFLKYAEISDHKNKVNEWRKALTHVGELKGFNLDNDADGHEAKFIHLIVKEVLDKLQNYVPFGFTQHLVGIDSRVKDVMKLLSIKEDDVRMIGIVGMGGIGKTTLSGVVHREICREYVVSIFLSNVREGSKGADGLVCLQKKLLCAILRDDDVKINEITEGKMMIKQRFSRKKALIVVDDVDSKDQLEALVGEKTWFGQGSRVIITTRDEHVLNVHGLTTDQMYMPNELNDDDSLQLFSYHAFRRGQPTEEYMELSKKIVSTTGGLPLALEVIGSFLSEKRKNIEWEEFLQGLKEKTLIQDKLRTSYDRLNEEEKIIFLDIACFFINHEKDDPIAFWQGCGLKANLAVKVLLHRSLIKMNETNRFQMHDQIRDMGRGIVSEMHPQSPGMQSRIWSAQKALEVLINCEGSTHVEVMDLDHEETRRTFNTKSFKAMENLRILRANKATIEGNFKHMPIRLRWLEWQRCPMKSLPNKFNLGKTVFLDLSYSKVTSIRKDWWFSPKEVFKDLRVLRLNCCSYLEATPDFSTCPNLEYLSLVLCLSLVQVHESVGTLKRLRRLSLGWCKRLQKLPRRIWNLPVLEVLDLEDCGSLRKFPDYVGESFLCTQEGQSLGTLEKLHVLKLSGCRRLELLPDAIGRMKELNHLHLSNTCIEELPESVGTLKRLRTLWLNSCIFLVKLPSSIWNLHVLEELDLENCLSLMEFPDFVEERFLCTEEDHPVGTLEKLLRLNLHGCLQLRQLPDAIGRMKELNYLYLSDTGFGELPGSIGKLTNLTILDISTTSIKELPDFIGKLTNLTRLDICTTGIEELLDFIGNMTNLTTLDISNTNIKELPDSIQRLQKLKVLKAKHCYELKSLPCEKMKSLEELEVEGRGHEMFKDDDYFEGPQRFVSMSGHLQQSSSSHQTESRLLQLKTATNSGSEWELVITVGVHAAHVVKVKAFYEEEWSLYRGMQWLRFIFSRDFVIDEIVPHDAADRTSDEIVHHDKAYV